MSLYRTSLPRTLRRSSVRLNNLVMFPASFLPYKNEWQQIAINLPQGNILVILPGIDQPLRKAVETIATLLEANGHRVTTIPGKLFAEV